jgi:hypothetical protein
MKEPYTGEYRDVILEVVSEEDIQVDEILKKALDGPFIPRDLPEEEEKSDSRLNPDGSLDHTFLGKTYHFTPEEMENARYYISKNYAGAKDVTDEEGRAFNEKMRALTDYKLPGTVTDETLPAQRKEMGAEIPVKELRHGAPPKRFDEIMSGGIRPKITDKVGTDKYRARRFGVFLGNGYTSSEGGDDADIFRVKVSEDDLRVDSGYTPYGDNLYVERTIKPNEIEHLGHLPAVDGGYATVDSSQPRHRPSRRRNGPAP